MGHQQARTLVLAGNDNPVTPLVNHRVMAALIPQARLHVAAGGGHLVLIDSADQIGPVITGFLRQDREASPRRTNQPN